jgi:hypothetical protein
MGSVALAGRLAACSATWRFLHVSDWTAKRKPWAREILKNCNIIYRYQDTMRYTWELYTSKRFVSDVSLGWSFMMHETFRVQEWVIVCSSADVSVWKWQVFKFKGRRQLRCGPENEWFPLCCERNMQNVCLSIYGWWFQSLKKCICHYWALCSDSLHLFTFFYMDVGFGIIMLHIGDGEANGSTSVWNRWDFSECGLVSGLSSAGTLWAHVDWHFYCVCLVL